MTVNNPNKLVIALPQQNIDKLVSLYQGSFAVPLNGTATSTVNHNLGTACLSELLWTTDGTNYYPGGGSRADSLICTAGVGATTATIYGGWYTAGAATTISYKLYLIWPV